MKVEKLDRIIMFLIFMFNFVWSSDNSDIINPKISYNSEIQKTESFEQKIIELSSAFEKLKSKKYSTLFKDQIREFEDLLVKLEDPAYLNEDTIEKKEIKKNIINIIILVLNMTDLYFKIEDHED